jgi:TetR/AcrR family transcriptional regulator, cholesterol catabolism regulator
MAHDPAPCAMMVPMAVRDGDEQSRARRPGATTARDGDAQGRARNGAQTARAIRAAALELFAERGYHATSLRDIGARVGMHAGSLYNHIASKEELLVSLLKAFTSERIAAMTQATAGVDDPIERLRALLDTIVIDRSREHREIFVSQSELRAVDPERRREIIALRDEYEELIGGVLDYGASRGVFDMPDRKLAIYAIIAIAQQVDRWYRPDGRLSREEISRIYQTMVLRSLRAPGV